MKKDYWLLIGSVLFTLIVGLLLIRWMAPQLFGMPGDSKIVKLSKEMPAFYETLFNSSAERDSTDFLLNDPVTLVRARSFAPDSNGVGPHDALGFRNYSVPNRAAIIAIGDSQTYGNNVSIESNWPNQMAAAMGLPSTALYSMATGGWSAVQYFNMFLIAPRFQPRVVMVAYYTGNDPLESYKLAYGIEKWSFLQPDKNLSLADLPNVPFPPPESEWWTIKFKDGSSMVFTPHLRYYSNDPASAAVKAGYAIIGETARIMDDTVKGGGVRLIVTIIPSKEWVYAKRLEQEGITPSKEYQDLIAAESNHIQVLEGKFKSLAHTQYVNVAEPLRQAALQGQDLYPRNANGHPIEQGYALIGETMAKALSDLPKPPYGISAVMGADKQSYQLYLINHEGAWKVPSESLLEQNGWKAGTVREMEARDLAFFPWKGLLHEVDPKRFGPPANGR